MRAPFQVIVFPYRKEERTLQVLIGKRADDGTWQAISGGGENTETPLEAAKRELMEESNLTGEHWQQLDSRTMLPKVHYAGHEAWGDDVFVIPEYAFAVETYGLEVISFEHSEFRWVDVATAHALLKYDSNKVALWELCQRVMV